MTLGGMVRAAREERRWSQAALAAEVSVTAGQISRIESGARGTDVETLNRLVRVLDLDAREALRLAAAETAATEAAA